MDPTLCGLLCLFAGPPLVLLASRIGHGFPLFALLLLLVTTLAVGGGLGECAVLAAWCLVVLGMAHRGSFAVATALWVLLLLLPIWSAPLLLLVPSGDLSLYLWSAWPVASWPLAPHPALTDWLYGSWGSRLALVPPPRGLLLSLLAGLAALLYWWPKWRETQP